MTQPSLQCIGSSTAGCLDAIYYALQAKKLAPVGPFGGDPFAEDLSAADPFTASDPFTEGANTFAVATTMTMAERTQPTVQDLDHLVRLSQVSIV